jgi:hypothetical protein
VGVWVYVEPGHDDMGLRGKHSDNAVGAA